VEYTITPKEKRRQTNLLFQLWRVSVLSLKFMRLTRLGCARPGRSETRPGP
jgi:hypothetical protein